MVLFVHIVAGTVGLISGFVALYAAKGAKLHRKSGMLFVGAMLTLSITGAGIAAFNGGEASVIGGLLTAYLVTTSLLTVRPLAGGSRPLDAGLMLMALALAVTTITLGIAALAAGQRMRQGIPVAIFLIFGAVALLASAGDLRMIRAGGIYGASRLARHLWRMCFALWIAASSFFLGQAKVIPEPIRIPALLALPPMAVLAAMLYWLWRVRFRKSYRGIVGVRSHDHIPERI